MNLPMVSFIKKEILILPPGEPREQHLGNIWQKKVWATQHFIKDEMTGSVYSAFLRPTSSGF